MAFLNNSGLINLFFKQHANTSITTTTTKTLQVVEEFAKDQFVLKGCLVVETFFKQNLSKFKI